MRIVDRTTFLALPAGTVYTKYQPCFFEGLCIKGDTLTDADGQPIDWYVQDITGAIESSGSDEWAAKLDAAQHLGFSVRFDFNCEGRDGCFDEDQWFAVWERADVEALIERLQRTVTPTTPQPDEKGER